jgi:hypothetical protein
MWWLLGSPYRVGNWQLKQPRNKEPHEGHKGILQGSPQGHQLWALHHLCKVLQNDTLLSQAPQDDVADPIPMEPRDSASQEVCNLLTFPHWFSHPWPEHFVEICILMEMFQVHVHDLRAREM